ncbi:MAG TPA: helix-turn-helix domain-containing protein [Acidimicrobiales bacterium]|nr:helix-turn-helix domain-containing protein [Acidimicrobiales bacterium]
MTGGEVSLVRWPLDDARLTALRRQGRARLLVIENGEAPPITDDPLEDWIRVPAPESDLEARIARLERRLRGRTGPPHLDEDGVLRADDGWVALPPVESRLAAQLLDRWGAVVSRADLARAGWPAGAPGRNALDVHVLRLRRRLEPLGLAIRTVRSRGYLLERAAPDTPSRRL